MPAPSSPRRAWQQLDAGEDDVFWRAFEQRYEFRPSVDPARWPGITEPLGSVTFDLSPVWSGTARTVTEGDVNAAVLAACQAVCGAEESMAVLDWQHPCYLFWPHRWAGGQPWPVEPTPNGDYYIFVTQDVFQGSFGHPWERSLCVFGEQFAATAVPLLQRHLPVLRSA